MNIERLNQIEEIYYAVLEIPNAKREKFLAEQCGADDELRREIVSLLSFEDTSETFLDAAPESLAAEIFAELEESPSLTDREIGHYRIKQLLGKGGMGAVYLAEDLNLNRRVALKFLSLGAFDDKNSLRRFKQEAFAASSLNHPNILTVYEFGLENDLCYLATEYIEGATLREILQRGKLTITETLNAAEQIAFALAAAHKAKIVHRDIKPENIMLREEGFVKILDFGLAKLTEQPPETMAESSEEQTRQLALTKPGAIIGTAAYMSPEQVRGRRDIDGRTDIWSLGVVLYEMLTGGVPFTGETASDTIASILKTDAPRLSVLIDDCPPELERIIDKAIAKNLEERYQSMQELASDLKNLKRRLEFEAELKSPNFSGEVAIDVLKNRLPAASSGEKEKAPESVMQKIAVVSTGLISIPPAIQAAPQIPKSGSRAINAAIAAVLLIGLSGVLLAWKFNAFGTNGQTAAANQSGLSNPANAANTSNISGPAEKSARSLNYSLTVQSYNDGRYKNPFKLSGEMLFRNKDRVRLNIESPQTGFLYILNESPRAADGTSSLNILFPSPTTNDGAARLPAGQEIQIPQDSWFELDDKEGTEIVWLVWSETAIPELESAKRFANPSDKGKIKDAALVEMIGPLLRKYQSGKENVKKDDDKKISQITANTAILTHIIKLEHH